MRGHTPGPWTWDEVPLPGLGPNRWCEVLNSASGPAVLRHEASGGPTPWGVSEPDKALIAAAPDLLEALRPFAAREECEIGVIPSEDDDLHNQACGECGTILIARRAIAKAEGR